MSELLQETVTETEHWKFLSTNINLENKCKIMPEKIENLVRLMTILKILKTLF